MKLAHNLDNLGTETAFAVSALASEFAAQGNQVFPFHLGDINLLPPQPMIERISRAINAGYNGYCPGAGIALLREQFARVLGDERGMKFAADNVSVQPGGKPVIGKFLACVMNRGDEVLYPLPGFPIYASQIDYQGGVAVPYYYRHSSDGVALDLDSLARAITPKTRALIYNDCHNPSGATADDAELDAIAELAVKNDLWVLSDEAYANIRFDGGALRSIAARPNMASRTVILFTCSKQFAMTGWRLGAAIGAPDIIAQISKFNTNAESCTTHFMQQAVGETLRDTKDIPSLYASLINELRTRRDSLVRALQNINGVSVATPQSGFYVYPNITEILQAKKLPNADALMRASLTAAGVSFCTGQHFGESTDTQHIRFAFSGIGDDDIRAAMAAWKGWVEA